MPIANKKGCPREDNLFLLYSFPYVAPQCRYILFKCRYARLCNRAGRSWHLAAKTLLDGDISRLLQLVYLYAQVASRCSCLLAQIGKVSTLDTQ